MTKVVVDASVLIACALADGATRRTFLSAGRTDFFAPEFVTEELRRKSPKLILLSRVAPTVLAALIDDIVDRLVVVPRQAYSHHLTTARELTLTAAATGDEDYVALALTLDAPVCSLDKDFKRIRGIRTVTRIDIA